MIITNCQTSLLIDSGITSHPEDYCWYYYEPILRIVMVEMGIKLNKSFRSVIGKHITGVPLSTLIDVL